MADYEYYRSNEMRAARHRLATQEMQSLNNWRPPRRNIYIQWLNRVLWVLESVAALALGLRVILVLVDANGDFAESLISLTNPFAGILQGVIAPITTDTGAVLEINTLVLILLVAVLTFVLTSVIYGVLRKR